ncbi:MDR family MFS transporter [Cohnella soli]|uniref:MDR family MFS transporter n=1 Tax=Cohnella soli TaxID=425005 RepID=A0ABW0I2B9_9BACL
MEKRWLTSVFGRYDSGIWIRVLGVALTTITGFMIRPFLVLYLYDKLASSVILPMLIVGLQPLCGLFVNWFGGGWSDRFGRKPLMMIALALQMLCMVGYVFAEEAWHYALISIVNGIGFALYMPAANAQMTDMVTANKRAEIFALLHTAFNVGAAVGPVLGLLMFSWNPSAVFLLSALSYVAYMLLVWLKLPETAPLKVGGKAVSHAALSSSRTKFSWKQHRTLVTLTLFSLPVGLLYAQVESTFPLHLQTNFEHFKTVLAAILAFNGLMVIALQIWIAKKTEAMASSVLIGCSYGVFALVAIGYGYTNVVVLLFLVEFAFTIGEMVNGPHMQKAVSLLAPEEQRGFYFSVYGSSQMLSRGLGPIAGGAILVWANGETLFTMLAVLLLLAGFGQYKVLKRVAVAMSD